jgi:hypothetical protein
MLELIDDGDTRFVVKDSRRRRCRSGRSRGVGPRPPRRVAVANFGRDRMVASDVDVYRAVSERR